MKKTLNVVLAAALASGAVCAQAYETGDWVLRVGAVTVDPDASSDKILNTFEADVDSDTQLSIIPAYMVTDNIGLELLAATPFKHDISVSGGGVSLDAGSTKQLPPTLTVHWYPRGGMPGWQPYLGIGLNYTHFFEESVDGQLKGALGATGASLELDDSFGFSGSAGVDIPLGDHWAINAGLWYIDINTKANLKAKFGDGTKLPVKFDVDINPWVYNFGVAYKF